MYQVDNTRIYATGFSNGAGFSFLLWARRGQKLAAIGECAGHLALSEQLTVPRALVAITGKEDMLNTIAKLSGA